MSLVQLTAGVIMMVLIFLITHNRHEHHHKHKSIEHIYLHNDSHYSLNHEKDIVSFLLIHNYDC